jgi:hypothetical protein
MSWLYSQALVEAYLGDTFLDGEQSAPSSGSHTQQAYCAPGKMTAFSHLFQSGMTYKLLTANHGEALLMSYLEAFHAKTSQSRGGGQELMENEAECGEKWRGSFTKYSPDSRLWKTHQCSLLGDSEQFSETWPAWGLMRDGECWEQQTLEQTIRGTESGSLQKWPTPDASCGQRGTQPKWTPKRKSGHQAQYTINQAVRDMEQNSGGKLNPMWLEWVMGWPLAWTDLKPLEMDKSLYAQQQHGNYSVKEFND